MGCFSHTWEHAIKLRLFVRVTFSILKNTLLVHIRDNEASSHKGARLSVIFAVFSNTVMSTCSAYRMRLITIRFSSDVAEIEGEFQFKKFQNFTEIL